jgi:hypothetical protein
LTDSQYAPSPVAACDPFFPTHTGRSPRITADKSKVQLRDARTPCPLAGQECKISWKTERINYRYATIVTSQWDTFAGQPGLMQDSSSEMAGILNPATSAQSRRYHGAAVYHHGIDVDPARPAIRILDMDQCADERVKLVRTMIKNRYGTIPHVKPQVIRDMEQGTWYDTEAAKVLRNRQSTLKLSVRKDFVRVTVIEEKQLRDLPGSKASRSEKPQVPQKECNRYPFAAGSRPHRLPIQHNRKSPGHRGRSARSSSGCLNGSRSRRMRQTSFGRLVPEPKRLAELQRRVPGLTWLGGCVAGGLARQIQRLSRPETDVGTDRKCSGCLLWGT